MKSVLGGNDGGANPLRLRFIHRPLLAQPVPDSKQTDKYRDIRQEAPNPQRSPFMHLIAPLLPADFRRDYDGEHPQGIADDGQWQGGGKHQRPFPPAPEPYGPVNQSQANRRNEAANAAARRRDFVMVAIGRVF